MTLVLTELSKAGVAMAADSAITMMKNGKIVEIDEQGWQKLIRVPKIDAAISYWGMIGAITNQRFDRWLEKIIASNTYTDLSTLGDLLVDELNKACKNKPLKNGYDTGIHLAGFAPWSDGHKRPFFYHIHNGHGRFLVKNTTNAKGDLIAIDPKWDSDPRKLFEKHQDFPKPKLTVQQNLMVLDTSYITRNGDFFIYSVIHDHIQKAQKYLNLASSIRIPKDPNSILARKGLLHIILESIIRFYRCSNQSRVIGGTVTSVAISSKGLVN